MAGNDEVIMEEILLAIQSIKPENIGDYNEIDLSPLEIGAEDIRTSIAPTAYAELAKAVINLTDKQTVFLVFMSFRKTYEYVFHLHNKYKMKFHPTLSDEKNEKLGSTLEMAALYYNIVRKQEHRKNMKNKKKFKYDMIFMDYLGDYAKALTEHSFMMRWFPVAIQDQIESLCMQKPVDGDLGGLLNLMMFAGIASSDHDYLKQFMCKEVFQHGHNILVDTHQNFAAFVFGITMDDGTRFLDTINKTCNNKAAFANTVLKRNSNNPNPLVLKLLRLLSIEVVLRTSMMILQTNRHELLKKILESNHPEIDKKADSDNVVALLKTYFPDLSESDAVTKESFLAQERLVGHELIVKAIMELVTIPSCKPMVFYRDVPPYQMNKFIADTVEASKVTAETYRKSRKELRKGSEVPKTADEDVARANPKEELKSKFKFKSPKSPTALFTEREAMLTKLKGQLKKHDGQQTLAQNQFCLGLKGVTYQDVQDLEETRTKLEKNITDITIVLTREAQMLRDNESNPDTEDKKPAASSAPTKKRKGVSKSADSSPSRKSTKRKQKKEVNTSEDDSDSDYPESRIVSTRTSSRASKVSNVDEFYYKLPQSPQMIKLRPRSSGEKDVSTKITLKSVPKHQTVQNNSDSDASVTKSEKSHGSRKTDLMSNFSLPGVTEPEIKVIDVGQSQGPHAEKKLRASEEKEKTEALSDIVVQQETVPELSKPEPAENAEKNVVVKIEDDCNEGKEPKVQDEDYKASSVVEIVDEEDEEDKSLSSDEADREVTQNDSE